MCGAVFVFLPKHIAVCRFEEESPTRRVLKQAAISDHLNFNHQEYTPCLFL